ncbi:FAD-binding oxidoreductase [Bowmanella dokdonensis]|uniref:FAD-binding oxidoreductase n=2 Tax=Bowmanella dokdonensis TaxID=751969 RepID=A0A939DJX7_9ALTE|nr:FAD-binding oxidoreductase [Bowmanella dokdonensis]
MYDPLTHSHPGRGSAYPDSYWASGVTPMPVPALQGDRQTEVAVIGGGYTGLSCAYELAAKHAIQPIVLEANRLGWGCSGRNAGFVLNGSGRLSFSQMEQKWGSATSQGIYQEYRAGIDRVSELIHTGQITCDKTPGGYLKVAHQPRLVRQLKAQADLMQRRYQDPVRFIDTLELQRDYIKGAEAYGALLFPYCFGIHPLKLALGYADLARQAGAGLYESSPVLDWQKEGQRHRLTTPTGSVLADKVVIASNGYTLNRFHPTVDHRHFPVLSSVIVTEPLNEQQLLACGIKPGLMVMDTRALKYYYRLLPDNRILFGGRGAIAGKEANHPTYRQRLLKALCNGLPQLDGIGVDYFWSGWVSVSLDDYPRICQADEQGSIFYSMGYCGSGVSFASQAGKRLAERVAGMNSPALPFFQSPLPKFPLARWRRMGLWGFYHWGRFRDWL